MRERYAAPQGSTPSIDRACAAPRIAADLSKDKALECSPRSYAAMPKAARVEVSEEEAALLCWPSKTRSNGIMLNDKIRHQMTGRRVGCSKTHNRSGGCVTH